VRRDLPLCHRREYGIKAVTMPCTWANHSSGYLGRFSWQRACSSPCFRPASAPQTGFTQLQSREFRFRHIQRHRRALAAKPGVYIGNSVLRTADAVFAPERAPGVAPDDERLAISRAPSAPICRSNRPQFPCDDAAVPFDGDVASGSERNTQPP